MQVRMRAWVCMQVYACMVLASKKRLLVATFFLCAVCSESKRVVYSGVTEVNRPLGIGDRRRVFRECVRNQRNQCALGGVRFACALGLFARCGRRSAQYLACVGFLFRGQVPRHRLALVDRLIIGNQRDCLITRAFQRAHVMLYQFFVQVYHLFLLERRGAGGGFRPLQLFRFSKVCLALHLGADNALVKFETADKGGYLVHAEPLKARHEFRNLGDRVSLASLHGREDIVHVPRVCYLRLGRFCGARGILFCEEREFVVDELDEFGMVGCGRESAERVEVITFCHFFHSVNT